MSHSVVQNGNPYTPLGPLLRRIERLDNKMGIFIRQRTNSDWATIVKTILPLTPDVPSRDIEILTHLHAASVARTWIEHHALLLHCSRINHWPPQSQAHWQTMLSQNYRAWLGAKTAWSSYDIDFHDDSASYLSTLEKIETAAEWWIASGAAEWSISGGAVWVPFDT